MSVHNDPPDRCTMHGFTRFLINSPLKVLFMVDLITKAEQRITILAVVGELIYSAWMIIVDQTGTDVQKAQNVQFERGIICKISNRCSQ